MRSYYINGNHTSVSLFDNRAFHYGECIITTCRVTHGEIKHYREHLLRLAHGVSERFFYNKLSEQDFVRLKKTLGNQMMAVAGQLSSYSLRVNCFFLGKGKLKTSIRKIEDLQVLIEASPLSNGPDSLLNVEIHKQNCMVVEKAVNYKNNQYSETSYLRNHPDYEDCDELLFSDGKQVLSLGVYNLFLLKQKTLYTPPVSNFVLDGVVRKVLIKMAKSIGFEVRVEPIPISVLESFDVIFGKNSLRGLIPIKKVAKKRV